MNLKKFSNKLSLKILSYEPSKPYDRQDDWEKKANGYRLQLIHKASKRRFTFDFWQGTGVKEEPTVESVLDCFRSGCFNDGLSFNDFCVEFGYNEDSIKELANYKALCKEIASVKRLLGNDYNDFLAIEDYQ